MQGKIIFACIWILATLPLLANTRQEKLDRAAFYSVMAAGKLEQVNAELEVVKKSGTPGKAAFEGTLLMKKAGIVSGPGKKLSLFKAGHTKLEAEIAKDSGNTEYRFLRLMIQENAPGILGYKGELQKDREHIHKHFAALSPVVQHAITDYSKKSKVLTPADL